MDYAQLRNLDTSKLTSAAEAAGTLSGTLAGRGGEVTSKSNIPAGMWQGGDAQAASALLSPLSNPLYDVSDSASQSKGALEDLVEELRAAKSRLDDAHDLAAGTGIVISGDGTVTTPDVTDEDTSSRNEETARQIREVIDEALEMATSADETAIGSLASAGEPLGPAVGDAMAKVLGPATGGALGQGAWAPWAMSQLTGRFGNLASVRGAQLGRFAPRGANGRFISPSSMSKWQRALAATQSKNYVAKPYQSASRANWATAGKWAGRAGGVVSVGTSTATQLAQDWNRTDIDNVEKGGRAGYRGAVQGGSAIAGGIAGAKGGAALGAAVGSVVPGVGTAVGGVVGGVVGGIAGGFIGSEVGGKVVDKTVDAVGSGFKSAVDGAGKALDKITPW